MKHCRICRSYAINPHLHDRVPGEDLDLCDVCYWHARANEARMEIICNSVFTTKGDIRLIELKKACAKKRKWRGLFEGEGVE